MPKRAIALEQIVDSAALNPYLVDGRFGSAQFSCSTLRRKKLVVRAILINATDALGHHGCTLVNRQINYLARSAGIEFVGRVPLASKWFKDSPRDFNCIIVNGEGTLHSNSKGAQRIAKIPLQAQKFGVPSFLINSIYQNNSSEILESLKKFQAIWVRDKYSQNFLESSGINAGYVPDLTFSWDYHRTTSHKGRVIVQDSALKEIRKDLFDLSRRIDGEYIPMIAKPIANITNQNFARISKFYLKKNFPFFLFRTEERCRYRNAFSEFDEFIKFLSESSLIITGRFHGITIALDLEIPFVALSSNSHKVESLLASMNMTHRLAQNIEEAEVMVGKQSITKFSTEELNSIKEIRSYASDASRRMFVQISREADQCRKRQFL